MESLIKHSGRLKDIFRRLDFLMLVRHDSYGTNRIKVVAITHAVRNGDGDWLSFDSTKLHIFSSRILIIGPVCSRFCIVSYTAEEKIDTSETI